MAVEKEYVLEGRRSHPYFIYDEIFSNPKILMECLKEKDNLRKMVDDFPIEKVRKMYIGGAGTSYFAAIAARYALERITGVPTISRTSFDILQYPPLDIAESAFMAFSFSGRTKISVDAIKSAKERGAYTIAVTGNLESLMSKIADATILVPGGRERIPVMTRSYTSEIFMTYLFLITLRRKLKGQDEELTNLQTQLDDMGEIAGTILKETEGPIIQLAEKYTGAHKFFFVGGGPNFATALEATLKIEEMSIIRGAKETHTEEFETAEGFETEEMCHGPFTSLDENSVLITIVPPGRSYERTLDIVKAAKIIGSDIISLVRKGEENELMKLSDHVIEVPESVDEIFTPIPYIIPLHLFDYYRGVKKGLNPDSHGMKGKYLEAARIIFPPGTH